MDASAYLRKHGWQGDGHTLGINNRGLTKALLISKKTDVLGVGLVKHNVVSDQWWLRAFDDGLKKLGTGREAVLGQIQRYGIERGGLYGRFIKGEGVPGTFGLSTEESTSVDPVTSMEGRVNGATSANKHGGNQIPHDPMGQHADEASANIPQKPDRKRKRQEQPAEKRARRKIEKAEKSRPNTIENKALAIEEGRHDAQKEAEIRYVKSVNRRAQEFVLEAMRRGIIPAGPNEIRKGLVPKPLEGAPDPNDPFHKLIGQVGLPTQTPFKGSGKSSLKSQRYERERMKRQLKRAAKAYLMGEAPPAEQTKEQIKEEKRLKREKKRVQRAAKEAERLKKEAERMAGREARAKRKREHRANKAAMKAEVEKIIAEREAAKAAGLTIEDYYKQKAAHENGPLSGEQRHEPEGSGSAGINGAIEDEFVDGKGNIALGLTKKGRVKKIPGVGRVDRYPTQAEKRAVKVQAMAIEQNKSAEQVQVELQRGRQKLKGSEATEPNVEVPYVNPEKLKLYEKRAAEKGMDLQTYISRRQVKYAKKRAEKQTKQHLPCVHINGDINMRSGVSTDAGLGFVVDTTGNSELTRSNDSATLIDSRIAVVDTTGDTGLVKADRQPAPLDPAFWEGQKVKDLPKHIRKARQQWLAQRRAERKARKLIAEGKNPRVAEKKSRGQRKVEAREKFVMGILHASRAAAAAPPGSDEARGVTTVEGMNEVPLVRVETTNGLFTKQEMALARTMARRVLRNHRRELKATLKAKEKGKRRRGRSGL